MGKQKNVGVSAAPAIDKALEAGQTAAGAAQPIAPVAPVVAPAPVVDGKTPEQADAEKAQRIKELSEKMAADKAALKALKGTGKRGGFTRVMTPERKALQGTCETYLAEAKEPFTIRTMFEALKEPEAVVRSIVMAMVKKGLVNRDESVSPSKFSLVKKS